MSNNTAYLNYLKEQHRLRSNTPQTQPVPGRESEMVLNKAGGYVFKMDPFAALRRALLLGTSSNSYYAESRELTKEFCQLVQEAIDLDPVKAASEIVYASEGRALNNSAPLLALTLLSSCPKAEAKQAFREIFPKVVRTASQFYEWLAYTKSTRGFGKVVRNAGKGWFQDRDVKALSYQFLKYSQRNGFEGRDLLRLFHLKADSDERNLFYKWLVKGWDSVSEETLPDSMLQIRLVEGMRSGKIDPIQAITDGRLTHEMVSSHIGQNLEAWQLVARHMPIGALVRNLGSLTAKGVFVPGNEYAQRAVSLLTNPEIIKKARIHPMAVIKALRTYRNGHGMKGKLTWRPIPAIVDALEEAFELSFEACTLPSDLSYKVFIDISGSMTAAAQGSDGMFSCAEAGALIACLVAKKAKDFEIFGFNSNLAQNGKIKGIGRINLFKKDSCESAMNTVKGVMGGGTDTSIPFRYLLETKSKADVVICLTDNETWAGKVHPFQLLNEYRKQVGKQTKVVYGTLQASNGTLTDPNDPLALDIAGFSPDVFKAIEMFINDYQDSSETLSEEVA